MVEEYIARNFEMEDCIKSHPSNTCVSKLDVTRHLLLIQVETRDMYMWF